MQGQTWVSTLLRTAQHPSSSPPSRTEPVSNWAATSENDPDDPAHAEGQPNAGAIWNADAIPHARTVSCPADLLQQRLIDSSSASRFTSAALPTLCFCSGVSDNGAQNGPMYIGTGWRGLS